MVTLNIRDLCILSGGAIGLKLEPTSLLLHEIRLCPSRIDNLLYDYIYRSTHECNIRRFKSSDNSLYYSIVYYHPIFTLSNIF